MPLIGAKTINTLILNEDNRKATIYKTCVQTNASSPKPLKISLVFPLANSLKNTSPSSAVTTPTRTKIFGSFQ